MRYSLLFLLAAAVAQGETGTLPTGQIVDRVACTADATQTYALYLPANYSGDRRWPVILAFDAGGRGRMPVERFQAAAEKFGYIVAGSYNSRNGPVDVSFTAAQAMLDDLTRRFNIDPKRMYAAGQSGGARFALELALTTGKFAGVVASSAGFLQPDPPKSVPFRIFGTAGTEDFNNLEMRQLDRFLTSPHRVVVFNGTHEWLPSDLAIEAMEWMQTGKIHDDRVLGPPTKQELAREDREEKRTREIYELVDDLQYPAKHEASMARLRDRLTELSRQAKAPVDSVDRQLARRILRGTVAATRRNPDSGLQSLMAEVRE
jgi:predicted esterase